MTATLAAGVTASHSYTVTTANTVPHPAMDRSTFDDIPEVLATSSRRDRKLHRIPLPRRRVPVVCP